MGAGTGNFGGGRGAGASGGAAGATGTRTTVGAASAGGTGTTGGAASAAGMAEVYALATGVAPLRILWGASGTACTGAVGVGARVGVWVAGVVPLRDLGICGMSSYTDLAP